MLPTTTNCKNLQHQAFHYRSTNKEAKFIFCAVDPKANKINNKNSEEMKEK
jgi:hypothetical protein